MTPTASTASQRRLAPDRNSIPARMAAEDQRRPEVRLEHDEHERRADEEARAEDRATSESSLPSRGAR